MNYAGIFLKYIPKYIAELGEIITFTPVVEDAYNTTTGEAPEAGTTPYDVYGVPSNYKAREVDGNNILTTDVKVLLSNPPQVPEKGHTAFLNNSSMRVLEVKKVRVQGSTVVYIVQMRV